MKSRIFSSKYIKTISKGQIWIPAFISTWISSGISGDWYGEAELLEGSEILSICKVRFCIIICGRMVLYCQA